MPCSQTPCWSFVFTSWPAECTSGTKAGSHQNQENKDSPSHAAQTRSKIARLRHLVGCKCVCGLCVCLLHCLARCAEMYTFETEYRHMCRPGSAFPYGRGSCMTMLIRVDVPRVTQGRAPLNVYTHCIYKPASLAGRTAVLSCITAICENPCYLRSQHHA